MTEKEWRNLQENFETHVLLDAVDAVDDLRDHFNDGEHCRPPELRTNLLKLHTLAMEVINAGPHSTRVREFFELASDLEDEISDAMRSLEQVQDTLSKLTRLYPESLFEDEAETLEA